MRPAATPINPDVRTAAIAFGFRGARSMLTRGRIERHLSENELAALLAVAYEAGAQTMLAKGGVK